MTNSNFLKLHSPVLGRDILLETNGILGPKHSALENFFYDQLPGVHYEANFVKAEETHAVVQATIWSETPKRKVVTNGEATSASLKTEIAKENPATMAFNRAFDRAVLKYLGLYGIYADSENVEQKMIQCYFDELAENGKAKTEKEDAYVNEAPVSIMTEAEEYKDLGHKTCKLRTYENKSGQKKYAPFGWILNNRPDDLRHFVEINANQDINDLKIVDPDKAESLIDLNRFLELHEKFKK